MAKRETPADRQARLAAGRAGLRDDVVSPEVQKQADDAKEAATKGDLSNPETQFRILNPETSAFALEMDDGRVINCEMRLDFKLADFRKRGVFEDLQALDAMVMAELHQLLPDAAKGTAFTADWLRENGRYIDAVYGRHHVQSLARAILARMSTVAVNPESEDRVPVVTADTLAEGLSWQATIAATVVLLGMMRREIANRKNAITAMKQAV